MQTWSECFFGGGKDGSLGAGARERMGREEEGVGERMDLYPLIKAANVKRLPTRLKTRLFPKGRAGGAVGLPMLVLMRTPQYDLCFDKTCQ